MGIEYGRGPTILVLPNELLLWIGSFLDEGSLAAMVQTSRLMNHLLSKTLYTRAVDFAPPQYESVVQWAAGEGRLSTIQKVFKQMPASADWIRVVSDGIMAAIDGDKVKTLEFLCQHPMSLVSPLNPKRKSISASVKGIRIGISPVSLAAHRGSYDALKFLLEGGVAVHTPVTQTAATMFEGGGGSTGDTRVAQLLIRHGFDMRTKTTNGRSLLQDLALRGSTAHVDLLAAATPGELNHQDWQGNTALMYAIAARRYHCAIHMVSVTGADVTLSNSAGSTALHMAAQTGELTLVETLVSHGANLNATDRNGSTALHLASHRNYAPFNEPVIVAFLLNAGAFCSPVDRAGRTPMNYALESRQRRLVDWLMLAGARHHAYEFQENDVLLNACRLGCMEIVELYAQRPGFDLESCEDRCNRTALHQAAMGGQTRVVVFLLATWQDIDCRDSVGRTALWHAARKPDLDCVKHLIHAGASIDAVDVYGRTPLMTLTRHISTPEAMAGFLRLSANVEWADNEGRTVLHHAARKGTVAAAKAIVEFQASLLGQLDNQGMSPLDAAVMLIRDDMTFFLKQCIGSGEEVEDDDGSDDDGEDGGVEYEDDDEDDSKDEEDDDEDEEGDAGNEDDEDEEETEVEIEV